MLISKINFKKIKKYIILIYFLKYFKNNRYNDIKMSL
jgi:hypothetical protein